MSREKSMFSVQANAYPVSLRLKTFATAFRPPSAAIDSRVEMSQGRATRPRNTNIEIITAETFFQGSGAVSPAKTRRRGQRFDGRSYLSYASSCGLIQNCASNSLGNDIRIPISAGESA